MSEIVEKLKQLKVEELFTEKLKKVKSLQKTQSDISAIDVSKMSERAKLQKLLTQLNHELEYILALEKVIKEKDF